MESTLDKIRNLPTDWWCSASKSSILATLFKKHTLPLLVAGSVNGVTQYNIYSGFLLQLKRGLFWLTAGHNIEELQKFKNSSDFVLDKMVWLDDYKITGATSVPFHRKDIQMKTWVDIGVDIGVIFPSELDVGNILKNEDIKPIEPGIWFGIDNAKPEGYYAIGYPRLFNKFEQTNLPTGKVLNSVVADLVCIPLRRSPPPSAFKGNPFWENPNAFYGEIIPFPDLPHFDIGRAEGMSGGLILSIERDPDGHVRYRLFGIIQRFAYAQSLFRAEPIQQVSQIIEDWAQHL
jgi:hypothetical protein